jgi:hypothetical protein
MPVTARLSQKFYERFGDDIANELVDWFNQVDATYRNDLRELNEANFQRFDAKLEQRVTASEARVRAEVQVGFANMDTRFARLEARLEYRLGAQMKWMFGFWLGTLIPLVGLMLALNRWGG